MNAKETIQELKSYAENSWGALNETFQAAIAALEKQIPQKPQEIDEREEESYYYLAFICPACEQAVIGQPYRPNYCKHCGQALDWDTTETKRRKQIARSKINPDLSSPILRWLDDNQFMIVLEGKEIVCHTRYWSVHDEPTA